MTDISNKPYITIIIATSNAGHDLKRCLDSIIKQTFKQFEILIQDNLSNDQTIPIIQSNKKFISHFESVRDNGIYDAWNRSIPFSKGEWICFIGSDDYFINSDVLLNYATFLKSVPTNRRIVYGINQIINLKGEVLYTVGKPWAEIKSTFRKMMTLPHPGLMHHRSLFHEVGLFNSQFKIAGDYEFLLRSLKNNPAVFWPKVVCATPIGGVSTLPENNLLCLSEIKRARIINGSKGVSILWIMQWIGAMIRLAMWNVIGAKRSRFILDTIRKFRGLDPFWTRAV